MSWGTNPDATTKMLEKCEYSSQATVLAGRGKRGKLPSPGMLKVDIVTDLAFIKMHKNTPISTLKFICYLGHSSRPLFWGGLWRPSLDHTPSALRCFAPHSRPSVTQLSRILFLSAKFSAGAHVLKVDKCHF